MTLFPDVLHCQKKTVAQVIGSGNEYVIQLKENQKHLFNYAQEVLCEQVTIDYCEEEEHGRHNKPPRPKGTGYCSLLAKLEN